MDVAINNTLVCYEQKIGRSKGIFFGHNPFEFSNTLILAQLSICTVLSNLFQRVVTPLGVTSFVAHTVVGLALGPSFLGRFRSYKELIFPEYSFYVIETFSYFGLILFLFLVGVKMDITSLRKSGNRAIIIGLCNFFIPLAFNEALAFLFLQSIPMEPVLHRSLVWIASFNCLTSFYVISCLLEDLKLLNSELGRLAISASMISGLCSWVWALILFMAKLSQMGGNQHTIIPMCLFVASLIASIMYILRPLLFWIVRKTGEDPTIKEAYICMVFLMILGSSMLGEIFGQQFLLGPMVLGLAVPEGPPLGTALVTKLDCFVSSILIPLFFVLVGSQINLSDITISTCGIVETLALFGFALKVMGTMLPSLFYYKMSVKDAVSLGLIMSAQGITELLVMGRAVLIGYMSKESFSIQLLSIVILTAATTPIVKVLYNPSKKYIAHKRRTIEHAKPGAELRLLSCIYHEDHTPSVINLLEASNPTPKTPIFFYVVHLIELTGRSAPILVAHQIGKRSSFHYHYSDHIINAFRLYEQHNQGTVVIHPFTAISPFETMHDEVCALALDNKVSMVILPFHKLWGMEETEATTNGARAVNRNLLRVVPCSVGILVDRGTLGSNSHNKGSKTSYNIGLIFLGGEDDREALAYANRMAKHPNVGVTVVRLIDYMKKINTTNDMEHDTELINEFRIANARNECCDYKEEVVNDSVGVVSVIREMENSFDLILVGKRHGGYSELLQGLKEWSEFPELGYFGDMLSSSYSNCRVSVLVVQQGRVGGEMAIESPRSAVVDMSSCDDAKVWPLNVSHASNQYG